LENALIQIWFLTSLMLGLMLLAGLFFCGHGHVLKSLHGKPIPNLTDSAGSPAGAPEAVVIIPVTGDTPGIKGCLESLLDQDYPSYEVIFVTRDTEDPAAAIIQGLLSNRNNARHITSGPAAHCGQKNHNLLAGIAASKPSAEILAFCDSSHQAQPTFLSDLLKPIVAGDAVLTTGFHRIVPGDFRLATLGMLWSVLGIHLLQGIALFTQPWGGAMAIRRTVFESHRVDRLWGATVVDDFSMGPYLRKVGIRCKTVPFACLSTPLSGKSLHEWNLWLTRQLLYLKFYTPGAWLGASLAAYLLIAPMILAAVAIIGGVLGLLSWDMLLTGIVFFVIFTYIGIGYRKLVPNPIPLGPWVAALYGVHFMTFWCYLKTWFTNTLSWKGLSYRVTWGGKVQKVKSAPNYRI